MERGVTGIFMASPFCQMQATPHSPRGVSSTKDFPFRSAPCATSNSTRCTCRQPAVAAWLRAPTRARNLPSLPAPVDTHLAPVGCSMQRLPAIMVLSAQAGSLLQQQGSHLTEPISRGDVQLQANHSALNPSPTPLPSTCPRTDTPK